MDFPVINRGLWEGAKMTNRNFFAYTRYKSYLSLSLVTFTIFMIGFCLPISGSANCSDLQGEGDLGQLKDEATCEALANCKKEISGCSYKKIKIGDIKRDQNVKPQGGAKCSCHYCAMAVDISFPAAAACGGKDKLYNCLKDQKGVVAEIITCLDGKPGNDCKPGAHGDHIHVGGTNCASKCGEGKSCKAGGKAKSAHEHARNAAATKAP